MSMRGTISNIQNCGTIVVVILDTDDGSHPIYFDHRPFSHLLEAEGCNPNDLIGRNANYEDETFIFED